jgi:hypothetical protein
LKRRVLQFGAIIGAVTVSALAVAPAFAAAATSQSTAQSLQLSIGGNSAISQKITASNDGTTESRNNASTVPLLADLIKGNNVLGAGVAPQDAHANGDGTSYACAGIAGSASGGVVTVGDEKCTIDGAKLTLGLGHINLDLAHLLGSEGAVSGPVGKALAPLTDQLGPAFDGVVKQLSDGLAPTPLGQISLTGALSAVAASCTANPDAAAGDAQILDTAGRHTMPISVTIPDGKGGTQTLPLVTLDVNVEPKPGGTDLLVDLDKVTQAVIDAVSEELHTALNGQISQLGDAADKVSQPVQDQIVEALVTDMKPALQQLSDNILKVTINNRTYGDNGRSVDVSALNVQVLPAAKQFSGSALVDGTIGHVTCGPNTRATATPNTPINPAGPHNPASPDVPNLVNSGLAGHEDHTARNVLGATAALILLAGTAGLVGYRRMLDK